MSGNPKGLRGGWGSVGSVLADMGEIGGYMETRKAVFRRSVRVGHDWARVVVGGLYGNPMCFVGRVVALWLSGNSLGFRGL